MPECSEGFYINFTILGASAEICLSCGHRASLVNKFLCLFNLPPTNLKWPVSFFTLSLPSVYQAQFGNQQDLYKTESGSLCHLNTQSLISHCPISFSGETAYEKWRYNFQHCLAASVTESGCRITAEILQVCFPYPWKSEDWKVQGDTASLQVWLLLLQTLSRVSHFLGV